MTPSIGLSLEAQQTSTWRVEFRRAEMRFFKLRLEDWLLSLPKRLEDLFANYDSIHAIHVEWLNSWLPLADPLSPGDFDGTITLQNLREEVVALSVRPETVIQVELSPSTDELAALGLGHLVA